MQKIYNGAPPPSPEEHHEVIESYKKILQGTSTQDYDREGLAQANAVFTISKSGVMAQLAHMTVTMNAMQAQLKTLASAKTNQSRSKGNFYCWGCERNLTHGRKTCSSKKAVHQEEAYYNKSMGSSEKECEWRLWAIFNKIKISKPKISSINHIDTPPNPNSTNILERSERIVRR